MRSDARASSRPQPIEVVMNNNATIGFVILMLVQRAELDGSFARVSFGLMTR